MDNILISLTEQQSRHIKRLPAWLITKLIASYRVRRVPPPPTGEPQHLLAVKLLIPIHLDQRRAVEAAIQDVTGCSESRTFKGGELGTFASYLSQDAETIKRWL